MRWHRGQSYMWRDPVLPALREGGWDPAGRTLGSAEESGLHPTFRASHVLVDEAGSCLSGGQDCIHWYVLGCL